MRSNAGHVAVPPVRVGGHPEGPQRRARRRSRAVAVLALLAALLLPAVSYASAPEAPELAVQSPVHATSATLEGVLHPGAEAGSATEGGTYWILYRESASGCAGAGQQQTVEGLALASGAEQVAQPVEGLTPGTTYTACLIERGESGETSSSPPVTFTTAVPPETPVTAAPEELTATSVKVAGMLNPGASGELVTGYRFAYSDTGKCVEGLAAGEVAPAGVPPGDTVPALELEGLEPSREYRVCLVAFNQAGEEAAGNEQSFSTPPSAPSVVTGASSAVNASSAHVEGTVNPNNQLSECKVEYDTEPTLAKPTSVLCEPASFPAGYGAQPVGVTLSGLAPHTTWYYRVHASNATGVGQGAIEHFQTAIPPETPQLTAQALSPSTAKLEGTLNPGGEGEAGSYVFLYDASESECAGPEGRSTPEGGGVATGTQSEPVSAELTGLKAGVAYTVCLSVTNSAGETSQSSPVTFTTPAAAPSVEESVSGVEANAATLEAQIDPEGAPATYQFQYGTSESYETSVPATPAPVEGSGHESASLSALKAGVTYHYRVLATNECETGRRCTTEGPDKSFTAAAAGAPGPDTCPNAALRAEQHNGQDLPECRAYELVSPTATHGQDATDPFLDPAPRASRSGNAITYTSTGSFEHAPGAVELNQFVSRRTPTGWATSAITPLHEPESTESAGSFIADSFDPELGDAILNSNAPLTPEAPLTHTSGGSRPYGLYHADLADGEYRYIAEEEVAQPMGTSTDLQDVVYGAEGPIDEWHDGSIRPVSVTNEKTQMNASVGDAPRNLDPGVDVQKEVWQAVSADGSRVYFTSPGHEEINPETETPGQLYLRVNTLSEQSAISAGACTEPEAACTLQISASRRTVPDPNGPQPARYWGASADGSVVYFTSRAELTDDANTGAADNSANLYECRLITEEAGHPVPARCELKDLTVKASGEGAAVQGVTQISEDGAYVYYVATGKLTEDASEGQPNLYVSHDGGEPVYIAMLSEEDVSDWRHPGINEAEAGPETNTAAVSPDGTHLAFISEAKLTAYDNTRAQPGDCQNAGCPEVYLYDSETATLRCASCDPSGARPVGPAKLNGAYPISYTQYRARSVLDDGTVFFDSSDTLTPHAHPGLQNVYEYTEGAPHALSDVTTVQEATFLDTSPTGADVFIGTAQPLLPGTSSQNLQIYDARIDGGLPAPAAPAPCESAETCRTPTQPAQGDPAPGGSAAFTGPPSPIPNVSGAPKLKPPPTRAQKLAAALRACHRDKKKTRRRRCEQSARKRYGARRHKPKSTTAHGGKA